MIPQPVAAVLMLYPLTPQQKEAASKQEDNIVACSDSDDDVWFIRQRIGNACGTIGLLHGLMNAPEPLNTFCEDSWLHSFQQNCCLQVSLGFIKFEFPQYSPGIPRSEFR